MNKITIILFVIFSLQDVCAQRKNIPIATINGIFCGKVTPKEFFNSSIIEVYDSIQIISYIVSNRPYHLFEDKFHTNVINQRIFRNMLYFHQIRSINENNDTILLNPIIISVSNIVEENKSKLKVCDFARANICGLYDGKIHLSTIINNRKICISPNDIELKIKSYWFDAPIEMYTEMPIEYSDSLSNRMIQAIQKIRTGNQFYLSHIIAHDEDANEYSMNPIILTIEK